MLEICWSISPQVRSPLRDCTVMKNMTWCESAMLAIMIHNLPFVQGYNYPCVRSRPVVRWTVNHVIDSTTLIISITSYLPRRDFVFVRYLLNISVRLTSSFLHLRHHYFSELELWLNSICSWLAIIFCLDIHGSPMQPVMILSIPWLPNLTINVRLESLWCAELTFISCN